MSIISQAPKQARLMLQEPVTIKGFDSLRYGIASSMNKLAVDSTKTDEMIFTYSKAAPEDLKRLTSKSIRDSYKRAVWVNPKDNKMYHILEESRNEGKVQVRILDKDGGFVKNAELTPKNIVIFDNFYGLRGVTHGEMMETFVKRFNPFANVERLPHKKNLFELVKYRGKLPVKLEEKRFTELAAKMDKGKKVDYISFSEADYMDFGDISGVSGEALKKDISEIPFLQRIKSIYEKITSRGTRILGAAGNNHEHAASTVNNRLAIDGFEGVGSLRNGAIAFDSCSRNEAFTQHYERRDYFPRLVKDDDGKVLGINITGLSGTDMPITYKTKKLLNRPSVGGTSYATPVRTAKLALNDMLEGIL